jgi:hypothetical protein
VNGDCRLTLATPFGTVVASVGITGGGRASLACVEPAKRRSLAGVPEVDRVIALTASLVATAPCRFRVALAIESPLGVDEFGPHSGENLECVVHEGEAGAIALAARDGCWLVDLVRHFGGPRTIAATDEDHCFGLIDGRGPDLVADLPVFAAGETLEIPLSIAWTSRPGDREKRSFAVWDAADLALPCRPTSNER